MSDLPDIASKEEAADYLRITPEKLDRLALAGRIGFIKAGLHRTFPRECIEEFVQSNTISAAPANPHGLTASSLKRIQGGKRI